MSGCTLQRPDPAASSAGSRPESAASQRGAWRSRRAAGGSPRASTLRCPRRDATVPLAPPGPHPSTLGGSPGVPAGPPGASLKLSPTPRVLDQGTSRMLSMHPSGRFGQGHGAQFWALPLPGTSPCPEAAASGPGGAHRPHPACPQLNPNQGSPRHHLGLCGPVASSCCWDLQHIAGTAVGWMRWRSRSGCCTQPRVLSPVRTELGRTSSTKMLRGSFGEGPRERHLSGTEVSPSPSPPALCSGSWLGHIPGASTVPGSRARLWGGQETPQKTSAWPRSGWMSLLSPSTAGVPGGGILPPWAPRLVVGCRSAGTFSTVWARVPAC